MVILDAAFICKAILASIGTALFLLAMTSGFQYLSNWKRWVAMTVGILECLSLITFMCLFGLIRSGLINNTINYCLLASLLVLSLMFLILITCGVICGIKEFRKLWRSLCTPSPVA